MQEQDYELGALDEATLDHLADDEARARQQQRGDERRWMILGATGTLALCLAATGALMLGGGESPHALGAGLSMPVLAAPSEPQPEVEVETPKPAARPRLARRSATPPKSVAPPAAPAKATPTPQPVAAQPEPTPAQPATAKATPAKAQPEQSFADLPALAPEADPPAPEPEPEPPAAEAESAQVPASDGMDEPAEQPASDDAERPEPTPADAAPV